MIGLGNDALLQDRERLARVCLDELRPGARAEEIERFAQEKLDLSEQEARAIGLVAVRLKSQNRTLPTEDHMAEKTDGKRLREFIEQLLSENPNITPAEAYARMGRELDYDMKRASFENTYFYGVRTKWRLEQQGEGAESPASNEGEEPAQPEEAEPEALESAVTFLDSSSPEPELPAEPHKCLIILDAGPDDFFNATEEESDRWIVEMKIKVSFEVMDELRQVAWRELYPA